MLDKPKMLPIAYVDTRMGVALDKLNNFTVIP